MAVLDADALIPILSCDVLLTMFEVNALAFDVEAITSDEFACRLLVADRDAVEVAVGRLVTKRQRHPVTRDELLGQVAKAMPKFAANVRMKD